MLDADLPEPGRASKVRRRVEVAGGKGYNQAVALRQLGHHVALHAVVGADLRGAAVLEQANKDHVDVTHVVRRGSTALLVDLVDGRRLMEDVPPDQLLAPADLDTDELEEAKAVVIQLQQPAETAALVTRAATGLRVGDGCPEDRALLAELDVLRADAEETQLLADGHDLKTAAQKLLAEGPRLVVLTGDRITLAAWDDGDHSGCDVYDWLDVTPLLDPTGAGDAAVAAIVHGWVTGSAPDRCARLAVAASGLSLGTLGGRPRLDARLLEATADQVTFRG